MESLRKEGKSYVIVVGVATCCVSFLKFTSKKVRNDFENFVCIWEFSCLSISSEKSTSEILF